MVFILLVTLSLSLLSVGLRLLYSKIQLQKSGIKTEGKVIRNEKYIENIVDYFNQVVPIILYRPVIEFTTKDGLVLQATCDEGSNPPTYKEGDIVNIIYPSNNPENFELESNKYKFSIPTIFISVAIMLLVFAIVLSII